MGISAIRWGSEIHEWNLELLSLPLLGCLFLHFL